MILSLVHIDDVSKGIVLATEKGKLAETYILAGEPISRCEFVEIWLTKPAGFKVRFYIPNCLAKMICAPLEPLQRLLGLPAWISCETVNGSVYFNYSSAKAQRKLDAFYVVISTTGIRKGEALALQRDALNLDAGTITIKHSLSPLRGKGLVLGEPKSEKSRRNIPIFCLRPNKLRLATVLGNIF